METKLNKAEMLKALCEALDIPSLADLARILGVTPQAVYLWTNRNSYDAELIANKLPAVSGDWLLTGKGDILKNTEESHQPENALDESELAKRVKTLENLLKEEQRMHAKAQEQCDRLLDIMKSIVTSEKKA